MSVFSIRQLVGLSFLLLGVQSTIAVNPSINEADSLLKEDIAAIQVLNTLCPKLIGKNSVFEQKVQQLSQSYLSQMSTQGLTLAQLSQDTEYQTILHTAQADIAEVAPEEQKTVCLEVQEIEP